MSAPYSPFVGLVAARRTGSLGQAPATEATQAHGFSTIEKVLIISTTIAAVNLLMNVYAMAQQRSRNRLRRP